MPAEPFVCGLVLAAGGVRAAVDLRGVAVVENPHYGAGCSASIAAALGAVDPRADSLVLLLGDQPGVAPDAVRALLAGRGDAPLAAGEVVDVPVPGTIPRDVDSWDDYHAVLAERSAA
jgi:molybdenum cofactor cytidylyltransferase